MLMCTSFVFLSIVEFAVVYVVLNWAEKEKTKVEEEKERAELKVEVEVGENGEEVIVADNCSKV